MDLTLEEKKKVWEKVLDKIKVDSRIDKNYFDTFLADSKLHKIDRNEAYIVVSSALAVSLFNTNQNIYEIIEETFNSITQSNYVLKFITKSEIKNINNDVATTKVKEEKSTFFSSYSLNSKYTFDNFVVGPSNIEAVQACLFVASSLGNAYNPLFIYSKTGLGKTHLLHALGNMVRKQRPEYKVLYITTDGFVDEFVKFSRGESQSESLKDYMKTVDVLLIDDIQFLAEKVKTSEMFFNIFNMLINLNKQIVITSDRHPSELKGLEERLVSRFNSGLSINIKNPDVNTALEILKNKISNNNLDINDFDSDGLYFLASNFNKNIRELEGALNKLTFNLINSKNHNKIDLNTVKDSVKPMISVKNKSKTINEERIIETVADYYHLSESQIKSKSRAAQFVIARQIAMYLCRKHCNTPFIPLGEMFDRDHSTVMTAVEKVDILLKTDPQLSTAIEAIEKQLKS